MRQDRRCPSRKFQQRRGPKRAGLVDQRGLRRFLVLFGRDFDQPQRPLFAQRNKIAVDVEQRRAGQVRLAPHDFAAGQLDAPQFSVRVVATARTIQITVAMDCRAPVGLHRLVAPPVGIGPNHVVTARSKLQQRASRTVGFGNEHLVADDHRVAGVDALQFRRPPGKMEIDRPSARVEAQQSPAGEHKTPLPAADFGQCRAGIAGQFVSQFVLHFATELVEGDDARTVGPSLFQVAGGRGGFGPAPPDLDEQQILEDDRCAADAEEVFHDAKFGWRVDLPDELAGPGVDAVQHPLGAEDVDPVVIDQGRWRADRYRIRRCRRNRRDNRIARAVCRFRFPRPAGGRGPPGDRIGTDGLRW